jgi:hypothetical protein
MARVQGVQEKVHLPIYDSIKVEAGKQLGDEEKSSTLKFFVDVQSKTKLETNLQSASLLPHYNTFEARAMRVVIGDTPAEFPETQVVPASGGATDSGLEVTDDLLQPFFFDGGQRIAIIKRTPIAPTAADIVAAEVGFALASAQPIVAEITLTLDLLIELIREARDSEDSEAILLPDDEGVQLSANNNPLTEDEAIRVAEFGGSIGIPLSWLQDYLDILREQQVPLEEQIESNNGAGTLIGSLIYNTVTSLFVGEKLMMQMPTYFFPAGAGPYSESGGFTTHGEPSPAATFRFAEPVFIDKQQNFRVEIEVSDTDVLNRFKRIYGPFQIWVILDGYMTRDVQ